MATIEQIKQLREETGVSIAECKKALEQSNGDFEKAKEMLRKWGKQLAEKKSSRAANQGIIVSYIHPNKKIGVLVSLRCETDFVAKSEDFQNLGREICMQIAAMKPLFLKDADIPKEFLDAEIEIYKEQVNGSGKPAKIVDQIIKGKLQKYKEQICLLSQAWIKEPEKSIKDVLEGYIARLGENISVEKFSRYEI